MGQLWNIPGSEGGAPEASGSMCEVEGSRGACCWAAGQLGPSLPQGGVLELGHQGDCSGQAGSPHVTEGKRISRFLRISTPF